MYQSLKLRFPISKIRYWSDLYDYAQDEVDIERGIAPAVRRRGYLKKDELLEICRWKTRRTKARCESNSESIIREVTKFALATEEEQLRIEALTLLNGVGWPTASVLLHFCHRDPYPIIDFRALWQYSNERQKAEQ